MLCRTNLTEFQILLYMSKGLLFESICWFKKWRNKTLTKRVEEGRARSTEAIKARWRQKEVARPRGRESSTSTTDTGKCRIGRTDLGETDPQSRVSPQTVVYGTKVVRSLQQGLSRGRCTGSVFLEVEWRRGFCLCSRWMKSYPLSRNLDKTRSRTEYGNLRTYYSSRLLSLTVQIPIFSKTKQKLGKVTVYLFVYILLQEGIFWH